MRFSFELSEGGWAQLSVGVAGETFRFGMSNLRDSPRDLLDSLSLLIRGSAHERVIFWEEPGEVLLDIKRLAGDLVHVKLYTAEDWGLADPDSERPVFRAKIELHKLAGAAVDQFESFDPAEYASRWGYPYPADSVEHLKQAVRVCARAAEPSAAAVTGP